MTQIVNRIEMEKENKRLQKIVETLTVQLFCLFKFCLFFFKKKRLLAKKNCLSLRFSSNECFTASF